MSKYRQHYLDQHEPKPNTDPLYIIAVGCAWAIAGYFVGKVVAWLF